ncbi:MAG TPA: hypothetical protein VJ021_06985 [Thermoplasmata archaeon]|nr:hypothetical protein [Thermoplasmata archaeon]
MNDPGPYYRPPGVGGPPARSRIRWFPIIIGLVFAGAALVILLLLLYPTTFGIASPSYRYSPFGGVFFLFFILIVVFFIVRVAFWSTRVSRTGRRSGGNYPDGGYGPNRPVMVARMRYARGEITREQYDQIIQDLGRKPGSP